METDLIKFIKQQRKLARLTQDDCARKAGVSLPFLRNLEQGKKSLQMIKLVWSGKVLNKCFDIRNFTFVREVSEHAWSADKLISSQQKMEFVLFVVYPLTQARPDGLPVS